ncbi:MAG: DUF1275 domain-containing protein [Alphaproteobacteria bacterium]|nr:DUF1275 domain-containing protein [Alphaproteobacteria bacterium]
MSDGRLAALIPAQARAALLCLIAGYVDAIGYLDYAHVFAANMTGNTVLLSISIAQGELPRVVTYALTLAAFLAGALAAEGFKRARVRPTVPLLLSGLPLIAVYALDLQDNWALAVLALGMGLQGGAVARFANVNVQTVVITGTMLKLAEAAIYRLFPVRGAPVIPSHALSVFWLTWLSYAAGAVLSLAAKELGPLKLLLPLVLLIPVAFAEERPS